MMNESIQRYSTIAILLHWLMAICIIGLMATGWYLDTLPKGDAKLNLMMMHKSFGVLAFGLVIIRILWRLTHTPPALPESLPAWTRKVANTLHIGLYVLMVIQPLSGYLASVFGGYKVAFFGMLLPQWGEKNDNLRAFFHETHEIAGIILAVLIVVHLAAAVKHMIAKNGIIQRMLP
jgi:cytochrome b561